MTNPVSTESGYTLIVTVVIVATVLLMFSAAIAQGLSGHRSGTVAITESTQARLLAESCAEVALLKKKETPTYVGNETLTVGTESCTIHPISAGEPIVVQTEATVDARPYLLEITISNQNEFEVIGWERVTSF